MPLLRANGEHLAALGFGLRDLRLALQRGILLAVALFGIVNGAIGSLLRGAGIGGSRASPAVMDLVRDPRKAPLRDSCAIVGGGFNEELVPAVTAFVYKDWPEAGLITGFTLGCPLPTIRTGSSAVRPGRRGPDGRVDRAPEGG